MDTYSESSETMTSDISTDGLGLVSIIIPAYNEENAIVETIEQVRGVMSASQYDYELIIVNDGSTDQTGEKAREAGARVINHEVNQGYGSGLKTGIVAAQGDWIVITDADGTYPNDRIPDLLSEAGPNDMVVGARVGEAAKIPLIRRPAKWALAQFANYLAETKIPDYNSGLRVFRKDVAKRFFKILPQGFSFTTTITLSSLCNGYRVKYIPIAYYERTGKSKIKPIRDTYRFFMLILRTTVYFNPMKVFMPISFILFSMGIAKLGHEIYTAGGVAETSIFLILASFQMAALGLLADMIDKRL